MTDTAAFCLSTPLHPRNQPIPTNLSHSPRRPLPHAPRHLAHRRAQPRSQIASDNPTQAVASPQPSNSAPSYRLTAAERARTIVSVCTSATLCTLSSKHASVPFGSHVDFILDCEGRPVFLLANNAVHTVNLSGHSKCSLFCQPSSSFGQEGCRTTLVGDIEVLPEEEVDELREVYEQQHTHATDALKFEGAFKFHRMNLVDVFFVGGYGVTSQWVDVEEFLNAEPDALAPHAAKVVNELNVGKQEDLKRLCRVFLEVEQPETVKMTSLDCLGFDVRIKDMEGRIREYRVGFREAVANAFDVQSALVKVFQEAWERENGFDETWSGEDVRPTLLYFAPA